MKKNTTYDFSKGLIKHQIEEEFYQRAGEVLAKSNRSTTIVTGPDFKRHINNYHKYIKQKKLRICEIDTDIFIDIYKGCKSDKYISVVNKSIELYGSSFIDCDLTCVSDIITIKNTLIKQIEVQAATSNYKCFIFSFSLRTQFPKNIPTYLRSILGLLGGYITNISNTQTIVKNNDFGVKGSWCKQIKFNLTSGRIKEYKCYSYDAGGGPMLTCLLIYK